MIQRTFILGDTWIYFKFYSGPKTADLILTEVIKPVSEQLISKNIINKWFFIRYSDPKLHLRVRFHLNDKNRINSIIEKINTFCKPFIEQNLIWKIQTDTYNRELERYGEKTMLLSEDIFFYDSVMIVDLLSKIHGDEGELLRWQFTLKAIDSILDAFNFTINQKLDLLFELKESYAREFNMDRGLKAQIDKKFRLERKKIEDILNKTFGKNNIKPFLEPIVERAENFKNIAEKILQLDKNRSLHNSINELLSSYIHMHVNRLFKSRQRQHELIIYDFLYRYYKSVIARQKYKTAV